MGDMNGKQRREEGRKRGKDGGREGRCLDDASKMKSVGWGQRQGEGHFWEGWDIGKGTSLEGRTVATKVWGCGLGGGELKQPKA